jgi:hypothetical protein
MLQPDEMPLTIGPGLEPPSQPDLPNMPPVVAYQAETIDPDTGEIV